VKIRSLLNESVRSHLMADVPLGVMLSGGLDSSAIAVIARKIVGERLKTFTFGYSDESDDVDMSYSRIMVDHLSTDHKSILISEDRLVDSLPTVIYHHDEPKVDPASIPTLIAGREVRRYATVVLVGEGSDEQFSGYVSNLHFSRARRYRSLAPSALARERIQLLADSVPFLRHQKRALEFLWSLKNQNLALRIMNSTLFSELELSAAASARFMKKTRNVDLDGLYTPLFRAVKGNEDIVASYVDLSTFVPHDVSMRVDKMMMASSVEARMPFLHVPILEYMPSVDPQLKIKHGIPKYLLRQAMKDDIPEKVLTRRKHGIQVPICRWVKQNIGILEQLSLDFARSRDILEKDAVVRIVKRAEKGGDKNAAHHLFAIGTLELWHKMYVDPEHWAPGEPQSITRVM